ncbi:MAG: hypothetical protein ACTHJ0_17570 [Flavipsychrobacter sp.]
MRLIGLTTIVFFIVAAIVLTACKHQPYVLPVSMRTVDSSLCFERDILPIFQSNCAKAGCHDGSGESDYVLNSYDNIVRRGIVPGNYEASKIYQSLVASGEDLMPKDAPALSSAQIGLIKRWIYEGAVNGTNCGNNCDTGNYTYSGAIKPMFDTYCSGCHNSMSAASTGGGYVLDTYGGVKTVALNGKLIGGLTGSGYTLMPQGGAPLSDCQITQVKKWIAAGALNN